MEKPNHELLYPLMEKVLSDTNLSCKEKLKLIDELRKNNPVANDRWAPRIAIYILGAIVIATILSITFTGKPSEGLIAIGSAAVGGIAGLISQVQQKNKTE
jgi:hypothetical protein|nr:hypothetical protein [uncultured Flavobacterium sp.]